MAEVVSSWPGSQWRARPAPSLPCTAGARARKTSSPWRKRSRRREWPILAPAAAGNTWYPYSFLAPTEQNEPYLSSALRRVNDLITDLMARGIPAERIAVLGFSQGACLALETAARNPRHYAGLIGFTGGLIGPPGTRFDYAGSLAGTSTFLGSSDVDPHIPRNRFEESAERAGASRGHGRRPPLSGHGPHRQP